uniref:Uncharacterized protein n=1 Tax=Aegilops tauschii subsp. strangulata TaxID=200361 RepID=A0A453FJ10_AEGTS
MQSWLLINLCKLFAIYFFPLMQGKYHELNPWHHVCCVHKSIHELMLTIKKPHEAKACASLLIEALVW